MTEIDTTKSELEVELTSTKSPRVPRRISINPPIVDETPLEPVVSETITVDMFKMWLKGVEEMQKSGWHPSAAQWKTIRAKIEMISGVSVTNAQVSELSPTPFTHNMPNSGGGLPYRNQPTVSGLSSVINEGMQYQQQHVPQTPLRGLPLADFTDDFGSDAGSIQLDKTGGRSTGKNAI